MQLVRHLESEHDTPQHFPPEQAICLDRFHLLESKNSIRDNQIQGQKQQVRKKEELIYLIY